MAVAVARQAAPAGKLPVEVKTANREKNNILLTWLIEIVLILNINTSCKKLRGIHGSNYDL